MQEGRWSKMQIVDRAPILIFLNYFQKKPSESLRSAVVTSTVRRDSEFCTPESSQCGLLADAVEYGYKLRFDAVSLRPAYGIGEIAK